MLSNWRNVMARRDLLKVLVVSELKASSAGTKLGWIWWLLDPLLMMLIYWVIVSGLLGRGLAQYSPYPIFIFFALITWKHLSSCANNATRVLITNEGVIKSVPFPTVILPLALVLSRFFYFLFGFLVLLAVSAIWPGSQHTGSVMALAQAPLLMALQVLIVAGICLPLASLGVIIQDLQGVMLHVLRAGFYLSPSLYGIDLVQKMLTDRLGETYGAAAFAVYMLNPFAHLITGYRDCLFYGRAVAVESWVVLAIEAAVLLLVGNLVYQHYDRRVIKFI